MIFPLMVCLLAIVVMGCINVTVNPPATTILATTPIQTIITTTITQTPIIPAITPYDTIASPTVIQTTISVECQDLLSAENDDKAFMRSIVNSGAIINTYSLADNNCTVAAASEANQLIVNNPKPKSPALVSSRRYLMSATEYCLEPINSATLTRTKFDLDSYNGKLGEYRNLINSCSNQFDVNTLLELEKSMESQGEGSLHGFGDDVRSFTVTGDGIKIFSMTYTGQHNFIVWLKDSQGNNVDLLANTIGSYNGKKSEHLTAGKYYLDIISSGFWTIRITSM